MAIRKPTMPAEKSSVFADFLKEQASVQDQQFKPGSIIEGTVSSVKAEDVFVDIGYKSEGIVALSEFGEGAEVKPGAKFQVMLQQLEDDKTGMVRLSKKAADDQIRWQQVLDQYTEGCVAGQSVNAVRGGSWYATKASCALTYRGEGRAPRTGFATVGFRLVAVRTGTLFTFR